MLTEQRLAELHQLRANGLSMRKCAAILGTNESMVYSALHPKVRKPKLKLPPPPKRPSTLPVKELRDHYYCPTPRIRRGVNKRQNSPTRILSRRGKIQPSRQRPRPGRMPGADADD
jgi:hypothetical protein